MKNKISVTFLISIIIGIFFVPQLLQAATITILDTQDTASHGQRSDQYITNSTWMRAQAFTTGAGSGGTVESLIIQDSYINPYTTGFNIKIYSMGSGGIIGSSVLSFNSTATHPGNGFLHFTPSTSYTLDPDTTYWLVAGITSGGLWWKYNNASPTGTGSIPASYYRAYSSNSGSSWVYDTSISSTAYGTGSWRYNFKLTADNTPDTTAPTVSITSPTEGQTVSGGAVSISANSTDNVSVAGVTFYVDGVVSGSEDTTSPYSISFNSIATSSGSHSVFAVARDSSNNQATSTTISFTVDNDVPQISSVSVSSATTSATITWTSDESSSSKVNFGITSSYDSSSSEINTSPRVTSHSVSLSGLSTCTKYHYQVRSVDEYTNIGTSTDATFFTTGCTGNTSITSTSDSSITISSGGSLSNGLLSLTVPTSFTATSSTVVFQIHELDSTAFFATASSPSGKTKAGDSVFNLKALINATSTLSSFDSALTVRLDYTDSDVVGIDETTLLIYRYDGSSWYALSNCVVNTADNYVECDTVSFSDFALFGDELLVSSSSSTSASQIGSSISSRVKNLISMGNIEEANKLKSEWTHLFKDQDLKNNSIASKDNTDLVLDSTLAVKVVNKYLFTKDLRPKMLDPEIKILQRFLNENNAQLSIRGIGSLGEETEYFGPMTQNALIRFQEMNSGEILIPVGLIKGTGFFGPLTRNFINQQTN